MKIHELLNSPEKWTQGTLARDTAGKGVDSNDYNACSWCLLGALDRCYSGAFNGTNNVEYKQVRQKIAATAGSRIINWNDAPERKWEEVYALVKELGI